MVSHKNYNLNANEGFVIFLNSKLITCFSDNFTLKSKSQSVAYLLNGSEVIYWSLDLEDEVHSIWVIWTSSHQECKDNLKSGGAGREHGLYLGDVYLPRARRPSTCPVLRYIFPKRQVS